MREKEHNWIECHFTAPSKFIAQLKMPIPMSWLKNDILEAYKCFNSQNLPRNYVSRGFKMIVHGKELNSVDTLAEHLTSIGWSETLQDLQPLIISLVQTEENSSENIADEKLQVLLEAITLHQISSQTEYKASSLRKKLRAILQEVKLEKLPPERHQAYHLLKFAIGEPSEIHYPLQPLNLEREFPLQPLAELFTNFSKKHWKRMTVIITLSVFFLSFAFLYMMIKNPMWISVAVVISLMIPQKHKGEKQADKERKKVLKHTRSRFPVFVLELLFGFLLSLSPFFEHLHFQNHLLELGLRLAPLQDQNFQIKNCFNYSSMKEY